MSEEAGGLRLVLVNTPPEAASTIARSLVEQKLAACVNVIPAVKSFYFWEGALQEDSESTLLIKTRASRVAALTEAVKKLHPYSVPEVVSVPISDAEGNADYLAWVRAETG